MWSGWTSNAHLWDMKLATHQPRKSKTLHLSFYYSKITYTGREKSKKLKSIWYCM